MKILVAEDSRTQAAMIKLALQSEGHEISLARDGIEAIQMAYREQPDLLVSDVIMPRLNGYQVCRLLKDDSRMQDLPVILLTSLDQKQDMFWGLKSGADRYLTKGGEIPDLVGEILAFLREREAAGRVRDRREGLPAGALDDEGFESDVMSRVVSLLDRNLFESTVVREIQNLVNILDDYYKTVLGVLEILGKVIDFHVGSIYLAEEESAAVFHLVNKPVGEEFIDRLRDRVFAELPPPGHTGDVTAEIFDPHSLLTEAEDAPAEPGDVRVVRLSTKGRESGIIAVAAAEAGAISERAIKTFEFVARHANIVVDYARLYERNKQLSITDGLTKLYNHRFFQEALQREFSRSMRHTVPLSLIMLDIDFFKKFNDTYGHQMGDLVLREIARVLSGGVRSLDVVARYGGEEFAVIMPDTEHGVAVKVAERLRESVERHRIASQSGELRITVSIGVASLPQASISNPTELINASDQALYRAKETGRNRVEG